MTRSLDTLLAIATENLNIAMARKEIEQQNLRATMTEEELRADLRKRGFPEETIDRVLSEDPSL
jgi:hypothetical protein